MGRQGSGRVGEWQSRALAETSLGNSLICRAIACWLKQAFRGHLRFVLSAHFREAWKRTAGAQNGTGPSDAFDGSYFLHLDVGASATGLRGCLESRGVKLSVCVCVYMCVCVCIYIYIYIYAHTYLYLECVRAVCSCAGS